MERYAKHCIFTWNIQGLAFCDESEVIYSPDFVIGNQIGKTWRITFYPNEKFKNEKNGNGISYYLSCIENNTSDNVTAHSCFLWKNTEKNVCFGIPREFEMIKPYVGLGFGATMKFAIILKDIEGKSPLYDSISLTCEIYAFITREKLRCSDGKANSSDDISISKLSMDMKALYSNKRQTDLEIKLKDGQISAHKAILCARSPCFVEMLKEENRASVELPDIELLIMKKILQFFYTGNLEELLIDDYSPFKLYECAKQFKISEITRLFSPQKYFATTCIETKECCFTWCIQNFSLYNDTSTKFPVSPVFKSLHTITEEWRMRISYEDKKFMTIMVERLKESEDAIQVLLTISLLDIDGVKVHTKRRWSRLDKIDAFGFQRFIERKDLASLLVKDVLTVDCTLRYSTGELLSDLDSKADVCDVDCSNLDIFSKDLEMLLQNGTHSDAVLVTGQKNFEVHRAMLSARSPVFSAMFEHAMLEQETRKIIIDDIEPDIIEILLLYIYSGKVDESLFSRKALPIYCAADKYAITLLKERCSQFLRSNLGDELVCEILIAADMRGDTALKTEAELYICKNAEKVLMRKEWQDVIDHCSKSASDILSRMSLAFCKE